MKRQWFNVCEELCKGLNWPCVVWAEFRQWAGDLPLCLLAPAIFLDLFKKAAGFSCSSKLGKYSVPKGDGGCAVRISAVFLTPACNVYGSRELKAKARVGYQVVVSRRKPLQTRGSLFWLSSTSAGVAPLPAFLGLPHNSAHTSHVCFTGSLAFQGLSFPFLGGMEMTLSLWQTPCSIPCCPEPRSIAQQKSLQLYWIIYIKLNIIWYILICNTYNRYILYIIYMFIY